MMYMRNLGVNFSHMAQLDSPMILTVIFMVCGTYVQHSFLGHNIILVLKSTAEKSPIYLIWAQFQNNVSNEKHRLGPRQNRT